MKILTLSLLMLLSFQEVEAQEVEAQESNTLSLEKAIELALQNSQQVRSAEFDVQIAESSVRESRSGFIPQVSLEAQYQNNIQLPVIFLPPGSPFGDVLETGTTHSLTMNLQASVPLFNATLIRGVSFAEANERLSRRMLEASRQEIQSEVQRAYLNILLTRESLEALNRSLQQREQDLELVESMVEEQVSPEYDLIRTQVQVENLRPQVREAENSYTGAMNYLKLLTGLEIQREIELEETLVNLFESRWQEIPSRVMEQNYIQNPDLMQQEAQINLVREEHRMNLADYYPSLSLVGVNMNQSQGNEFRPFDYDWVGSTYIGVNLSIPIFSGFQRRHQNQQSRIRIDQQEFQRDYLMESIQVEHQNALDRLIQARESIDAQELNVRQAERGYEIARVGYENGTQNLIEVNDAELAMTDARLNYLQSIYDYIDSILELERILGLEPSIRHE